MNVGDASVCSTGDEKSEKLTKVKLGIEAKLMKAIKEVRSSSLLEFNSAFS